MRAKERVNNMNMRSIEIMNDRKMREQDALDMIYVQGHNSGSNKGTRSRYGSAYRR